MKENECIEEQRKIELENDVIDFNFIDDLSKLILKKLTSWCNETIYEPLGGKLTFCTPLNESVNAGAKLNPKSPLNPEIIINMGMIREIYLDSLTFPIISQRIAIETDTIDTLNEMFENASYTFSDGVPQLRTQRIGTIASLLAPIFSKYNHSRLSANDYAVRFMMFEVMLAWVFFHELSHLIQCHYKLKMSNANVDEIEFYEINVLNENVSIDLTSQAREVLADLEGLDLTIRYMNRETIFYSESAYVLLCALACMFNRFYGRYEKSFESASGTHPHPVIRNEFIHNFFLNAAFSKLAGGENNENSQNIAKGLTYISLRATLVSGVFWAHRYLSSEDGNLPPFLQMETEKFKSSRDRYVSNISSSVNTQIQLIIDNHLLKNNIVDYLHYSEFFNKKIF